jgi:8-oxo-dGTP pyrophosphatase MutT (NUDIX family)
MSDGDEPVSAPAEVGPWRRHTRREVYRNPWLTLYHDEVSRPDGSPGIYGVVHFENSAVGVVAIDDRDRVALVSQHRYTLDQLSWEIPEGGVPRHEDPLEGAKRELREEVGARAERWTLLGMTHISNSVTDEAAHLYLATDLVLGTQELEASEGDLAVRWVPFDEVVRMCRDGRITDALSIIAVGWAAADRAAADGAPRTPRTGHVDTGAPDPVSSAAT